MKISRSSSPENFSTTKIRKNIELFEDYVEAINEINFNKGFVKNVDLCKYFGVSNATVCKNIKRLIKEELVESEKYRSIFLTKAGKILAEKSNTRHEVLYKFLTKLGVPNRIAEIDSEGMEHHISTETLNIMKKFNNSN
ncbi:MAG: transcriptional regulator [Pelagibacteraceae bacterium TMED136]|nr:MAG: transcriptional regulator [Pelagibacteraceae bacterium TMED136]|tara:strand:+ start:220 stop:636 length:417 start_codon:yes stop_codon:yes gene_type:complete